jgi:hypothetical protein
MHVAFSHLELRFDQHDVAKVSSQSRDERGQNHRDGNETDVDDYVIDWSYIPPVHEFTRQIASVRPLDDVDAKICAKRGMKLTVSDIQCDDPRCTAKQGHLGESTRGCADVKHSASTKINPKPLARTE